MRKITTVTAYTLAAMTLATGAYAQSNSATSAPASHNMSSTSDANSGSPSDRNPVLTDNGDARASKVIGSAVYNDNNQKVGTIDDIVIPDTKPVTPRELKLAQDLVAQLSGPFDPSKHPDEYRTAVLAAVDRKVEAQELARDTVEDGEREAATGAGGKVIDLAELLSRSLGVAGIPDASASTAGPGPAKAQPANEAQAPDAAKEAKPGPKKGSPRETKKRAAG